MYKVLIMMGLVSIAKSVRASEKRALHVPFSRKIMTLR
jgi:hypothetical protein